MKTKTFEAPRLAAFALRLLPLITSFLLAGCSNPVARHYLAVRPATPLRAPSTPVEVREAANLAREEERLQRDGWEKVGSSDFSAVEPLRFEHVREHARLVGAQLAVWHQTSKQRRTEDIKVTHYKPQPDSFERTSSSTQPPTRPEVTNVPGAQFREYFCHVSFWRKRAT